jgi:hypothetical protein
MCCSTACAAMFVCDEWYLCVIYTRKEVVAKEAIIVVFICDTHATGCTLPQLEYVCLITSYD